LQDAEIFLAYPPSSGCAILQAIPPNPTFSKLIRPSFSEKSVFFLPTLSAVHPALSPIRPPFSATSRPPPLRQIGPFRPRYITPSPPSLPGSFYRNANVVARPLFSISVTRLAKAASLSPPPALMKQVSDSIRAKWLLHVPPPPPHTSSWTTAPINKIHHVPLWPKLGYFQEAISVLSSPFHLRHSPVPRGETLFSPPYLWINCQRPCASTGERKTGTLETIQIKGQRKSPHPFLVSFAPIYQSP